MAKALLIHSEKQSYKGLLIALSIFSLWLTSIIFLFNVKVSHLPIIVLLPIILYQTFLYTGLFITVHDAIHQLVVPNNRQLNNFLGTVISLVYGLFSYKKLAEKHLLHHRHPATELDPDFHDGVHKNPFSWYLSFLRTYIDWKQILGLVFVFHTIHYITPISQANLFLFWVIPSILSSVQLFFFGTFLPHREPEGGYSHPNRAQTLSLPVFWSFITCYHFGYHEEHHEYPNLCWWQLPTAHRLKALPAQPQVQPVVNS